MKAVQSVAAQHSSDPVCPHLAAWARVPGFAISDLGSELYGRRGLWRMHAMRRTLFVVPADEAAIFEAGAARGIARKERRRLVKWLEAGMAADEVAPWLDRMTSRVLDALADGERSTSELTVLVPELAREITLGSGRWTTTARVSSRLLFLMAMDGIIVRAQPLGTWRSSQYRWANVTSWFGEPLARLDEDEGRVEIARRYLATHGPVTMTDLRWWTGWTVAASRRALAELDVATVELASDGYQGMVLADDLDDVAPTTQPTVALLPGLDSTPMGWKQRDWYLGPHEAFLYDSSGNVGPTVWVDGRIVGGWGQRPDGQVAVELLDQLTPAQREALDHEVASLTAWLDGVVATPRFPTPWLVERLSG